MARNIVVTPGKGCVGKTTTSAAFAMGLAASQTWDKDALTVEGVGKVLETFGEEFDYIIFLKVEKKRLFGRLFGS